MNRKMRGRGIAASWYGIVWMATIDRVGAWAELDDGGIAKIVIGVTEIGEGILTLLAQVAAEELGVKPEQVMIGDNDIARSSEAAYAGVMRQTYMIGNAVMLACCEAKAKLFDEIAQLWEVDAADLRLFDGEFWAENINMRMLMKDAVDICKKRGVVPVGLGSFTVYGTGFDPVDGSGSPWQAYVFGTQVAEVEVDTVIGEVQVLGIWVAYDVGCAINPRGVEGQIEGGVVQGLGQVLMEDYQMKDGHFVIHGFVKYILFIFLDILQINCVIVEDHDLLSLLGVKGIGEFALVLTAPVVMNVIYDAIGVRIQHLLAMLERVLEALSCKNAIQLQKGQVNA